MDGPTQNGSSVDSFLRTYKVGKTLGIGSFGKVKIAEHTLTGHKVAVKILNRKKIKNMDMEEKEVMKALQDLNVYWKKIGHYNMKCRWIPGGPGHHEGMLGNSMQDNIYFGNESAIVEHEGNKSVIKFELQLYKTREEKYLRDLQRIQGPQFLFLDLFAAFLAQLRVL